MTRIVAMRALELTEEVRMATVGYGCAERFKQAPFLTASIIVSQ